MLRIKSFKLIPVFDGELSAGKGNEWLEEMDDRIEVVHMTQSSALGRGDSTPTTVVTLLYRMRQDSTTA